MSSSFWFYYVFRICTYISKKSVTLSRPVLSGWTTSKREIINLTIKMINLSRISEGCLTSILWICDIKRVSIMLSNINSMLTFVLAFTYLTYLKFCKFSLSYDRVRGSIILSPSFTEEYLNLTDLKYLLNVN